MTWTYNVTNTGNVTLTNIVVTDNNGTPGNTADDFHPAGSPIASLAPGASTTLTATGTATAGQYNNIATADTSFATSTITIPLHVTEPDCYFGAIAGDQHRQEDQRDGQRQPDRRRSCRSARR